MTAVSTFTWMDYSEEDRRTFLDIIDQLSERGTRDELGIGTVRDGIAEILFPGTSTIQTRAGYFFFVPWVYQKLEHDHIPADQVAGQLRRLEARLIGALAKSDDPAGVIGIQVGGSVRRLPSNVYWGGLHRWGIRRFPGSQPQYHRLFDEFARAGGGGSRAYRNDEGEPADGASLHNWDPGIPRPPAAFPDAASFQMRRQDGEYLRDQIRGTAPGTLLAHLVEQEEPWAPTQFAWQHPVMDELPHRLQSQVRHARNFSEVIRGSALLYNLMLAELESRDDLAQQYHSQLNAWAELLHSRRGAFARWDRREFWSTLHGAGVRVPGSAHRFVEEWLTLALSPAEEGLGARKLPDDPQARTLVQRRERMLKRGRARLDNSDARRLWNGDAGTAQLAYRWPVVQTVVLDILQALRQEDTDA
jgi:hypothetical protein